MDPLKTIVLLSGGIDSSTILAACVAQGDQCLALGFEYSQPHRIELHAANTIANYYQVPFKIVRLPPMLKTNDVVFAGRNMVFISHAISIAQAQGFNRVVIGCNATDWELFPDCRPDFWSNIKRCAEFYSIKVLTPLIYTSKHDIIKAARKLQVPINLTWSCYSPVNRQPCDVCLACTVRKSALDDIIL